MGKNKELSGLKYKKADCCSNCDVRDCRAWELGPWSRSAAH